MGIMLNTASTRLMSKAVQREQVERRGHCRDRRRAHPPRQATRMAIDARTASTMLLAGPASAIRIRSRRGRCRPADADRYRLGPAEERQGAGRRSCR